MCSLILYVTILMYAGYSLLTLIERSDYTVLTEVQDDYFDANYKITKETTFRVAAAIT